MHNSSEYFLHELASYYAAQGKRLSENVINVLKKDPSDFNGDEMQLYRSVIIPMKDSIKGALKERFLVSGMTSDQWRKKAMECRDSLLSGLVLEMLSEMPDHSSDGHSDEVKRISHEEGEAAETMKDHQESGLACINCGVMNRAKSRFCRNCGSELKKPSSLTESKTPLPPSSIPNTDTIAPSPPAPSTKIYKGLQLSDSKKVIAVSVFGTIMGLVTLLAIIFALLVGNKSTEYIKNAEPIINKLERMESFTDVGINYLDYFKELRDLKAVYDEFDRKCTERDKKRDSYKHIKEAVEAYITAGDVWDKYINASTLYKEKYKMELQLHWYSAESALEKAREALSKGK